MVQWSLVLLGWKQVPRNWLYRKSGRGNTKRARRRDVHGKRPLLPPDPMPAHQPSPTSSICSMYSPSTRFISLSSAAYLRILAVKHTQRMAYVHHSHIARVLQFARSEGLEVQPWALALVLVLALVAVNQNIRKLHTTRLSTYLGQRTRCRRERRWWWWWWWRRGSFLDLSNLRCRRCCRRRWWWWRRRRRRG